MTSSDTRRLAYPVTASGFSDHPTERVAWLDCRGKTALTLLETLERFLRHPPHAAPSILLLLCHLERLEDSIVAFLLGLSSLLRAARRPVVLVEPTGYAHHVLSLLEPNPNLKLFRNESLLRTTRNILIVDRLGSTSEGVVAVLRALGQHCDLVQSASEARSALRDGARDCVLMDLELSHAQAFGLAHHLREHAPAVPLIGMTSIDDVWSLETTVRQGFRHILCKPYSIFEVLASIAEVLADAPRRPSGERPGSRPEAG